MRYETGKVISAEVLAGLEGDSCGESDGPQNLANRIWTFSARSAEVAENPVGLYIPLSKLQEWHTLLSCTASSSPFVKPIMCLPFTRGSPL